MLHGRGARALADTRQRHFALVAVERRGAHLDQLVVRERPVRFADHSRCKPRVAHQNDRLEWMGQTLQVPALLFREFHGGSILGQSRGGALDLAP